MTDVTFAQPEFFFLLLLVPPAVYWYWRSHRKRLVEIQVPTTEVFESLPRSWRQRLRHSLFVLRLLAFALLTLALARPQSTSRGENVTTEGIDIILATDISGSMIAEDFHPNRIEAAKNVAMDFIDGRPNDRIGLVIFSG